MKEFVDAFYRDRSIVNHQLASYDDFLNQRLQRATRMMLLWSQVVQLKPDAKNWMWLRPEETTAVYRQTEKDSNLQFEDSVINYNRMI